MTNHTFAVFDSKADAYLAPFTALTYGIAERMFTDLVNSDGHQFNRHPQDYTLYLIGAFDTHTAQLHSVELKPIISGLQALNPSTDSIPTPGIFNGAE